MPYSNSLKESISTEYQSAIVRSSDGTPIMSSEGVDIVSREGFDAVKEKITDAIMADISNSEKVPIEQVREGRAALEQLVGETLEGLRGGALTAAESTTAELLADASVARDITSRADNLLEALDNASETDPTANRAVLEQLQAIRQSVEGPSNMSSYAETALETMNAELGNIPDNTALESAYDTLQMQSMSAPGKAQADNYSEMASALREAYGDEATKAADLADAFAEALREGSVTPELKAEANAAISAELDSLSTSLVNSTMNSIHLEKAGVALEQLTENTAEKAEAFSEMVAEKDGHFSGSAISSTIRAAAEANGPEGPQFLNADSAAGAQLTPMENLRDTLGTIAEMAQSDKELTSAMGDGFAERVQELGITASDVQAAKDELQEQAREEGRDPASIDEAVALAALVERETLLERGTEHATETSQDQDLVSRVQDEAQEVQSEAQAEMAMGE